jgi:hypothetical protein
MISLISTRLCNHLANLPAKTDLRTLANGPPASANFARRAPRHPRTLRSITAAAMPALSKMDLQRAAA